ncbi:hypothetical protein [Phenylobacterium sp.]|uniref:hypothetical protein n=1 Tax=Phenylobacterium sp. TaxID=1871053 RepID=UPI00391BB58E
MRLRTWTSAALAAGLAGAAAAQGPNLAGQMKHVVNPAALAFWAAGNEPPERETPQAAEARWRAAQAAAKVLEAEGRKLAQAPYARPGRWTEFAEAMAQAGASAGPALQARDAEGAFAAGGRLYDSCDGCHKVYAPVLR